MNTPILPTEITHFLQSGISNKWLLIGGIEVYVRKSKRINPCIPITNKPEHIRCFDVANVISHNSGVGEFKHFFETLKLLKEAGFAAIYIENVLSDRFANFFRKTGCVEMDLDPSPSFYYFL